ncbi:aldehyde dehydrogenase family protein [Pseudomonas syringae]|uniref:aldehyde dehydrogenase family protein n=1 Tax=Pseudomonas syringae TaxID=317 RepID=UPI001F47E361|nr:aldehyde dehydrogenase family protein [Pseudomonas syringae]MCF5725191.1 aldehyde dehydrogenase family protein [Pseudomonas syringae]
MFKAVANSEHRTFFRFNPVTSEKVSEASALSVEQVNGMIEDANDAFRTWSVSAPALRRDIMLRAAELVVERSVQMIDCMVAETGTSRAWAEFNVKGSVAIIKEAAGLATQIKGETIPSNVPGTITMTLRVPAGVSVGIAPWNAPLLLGLRAVVVPIVCGNTAILKASEQCPAVHFMIGELLRDAGLPQGVLNVVTHEAKDAAAIVEALVAHPAVKRVNFTGSTKVGRIIGELAGKHLKPALLELGGKAPFVVLKDADIVAAAKAAVFGAFMNHGQICMSTERLIVDEFVADAFADELRRQVAEIKADGGLIGVGSADHVEALVKDATSKGATLVSSFVREGVTIEPVVLDHVTTAMRVYAEESFGPVAPIVRVSSVEEAIQVANDTEYGLAAAVFGRDLQQTLRVAQAIECGICNVNGATVKSDSHVPFGGVKASGFGRFGGSAVINEFTDLKTLNIQI